MQLKTSRFQRVDRILCTRDFHRLVKSGNRRTLESFIVIITSKSKVTVQDTDEKRNRLGVTVSKWVGNAVVRNRVKRHIREWFRHARGELPERSDIVVIARRGARDLSGCEVRAVLDSAIGRPRTRGSLLNDNRVPTARFGTRIGLQVLRLYQVSLSRSFGPVCRFEPSCSHYAAEAIEQFGLARGFWLALRRMARCHPLGGSGYDPVPGRVGNGP